MLTASREAVLRALEAQPQPVPITTLAATTGLHPNTVREHLDALLRAGLVHRDHAATEGRGRPAWLYRVVADDEMPTGVAEYAGLASALAAAIERASHAPREDAIAAGREWGRRLAAVRGGGPDGGTGGESARERVVALLASLGFAPETGPRDTSIKLTRCPLLEAAHEHPEVVCGVHLGLVRGAFESYGGSAEHAELLAFSDPGACRLDLSTTTSPMSAR